MMARNKYISKMVQETHEHRFPNRSLSIFCVSNKAYKKHRNRVGEHDIPMKGSGIPGLRSYCHKIPARAQFRIANHFLDVRLKDLVQQVQLWLAGGSQETVPNDRTVQKLLDTLQNELQKVRQGRTLQTDAGKLKWDRMSLIVSQELRMPEKVVQKTS
jgi:UDP-N-acetylglucosamine:LPS N-acetylglucosamine transferase